MEIEKQPTAIKSSILVRVPNNIRRVAGKPKNLKFKSFKRLNNVNQDQRLMIIKELLIKKTKETVRINSELDDAKRNLERILVAAGSFGLNQSVIKPEESSDLYTKINLESLNLKLNELNEKISVFEKIDSQISKLIRPDSKKLLQPPVDKQKLSVKSFKIRSRKSTMSYNNSKASFKAPSVSNRNQADSKILKNRQRSILSESKSVTPQITINLHTNNLARNVNVLTGSSSIEGVLIKTTKGRNESLNNRNEEFAVELDESAMQGLNKKSYTLFGIGDKSNQNLSGFNSQRNRISKLSLVLPSQVDKEAFRRFTRQNEHRVSSMGVFCLKNSEPKLEPGNELDNMMQQFKESSDVIEVRSRTTKPRLSVASSYKQSRDAITESGSYSPLSLQSSRRLSVMDGIRLALEEIKGKIRVPMLRPTRSSVIDNRKSINIGVCTQFINTKICKDTLTKGYSISHMRWFVEGNMIRGFRFTYASATNQHMGEVHGVSTSETVDMQISYSDSIKTIYFYQKNEKIKSLKFITKKHEIYRVGIPVEDLDDAEIPTCSELPKDAIILQVMSYFDSSDHTFYKFYLNFQ